MVTHALLDLIEQFIASDERLDIWRRYPYVTEEEDDATDTFACESVSQAFAAFARDHGWTAFPMRIPWERADADDHWWVRLADADGVYDVDFTARQYHNLDGIPDALEMPWPLVWEPVVVGHHPLMRD